MTSPNPLLFQALINALPVAFLRRLHQDIPRAYAEAANMADLETLWEQSEAEYVMPHLRRAIVEHRFRQDAIEAGLRATVHSTTNGSAKYTLVQATGFVFTISYVDEPRGTLREAQFRSQHAELNKLLAQQSLEGFDGNHALRFDAKDMNCVLLHGADVLDKGRLGFIEFAFPHPRYTHWIQTYPFENVLVAAQLQKGRDKLEDRARPKPKPDIKEEGGEGT